MSIFDNNIDMKIDFKNKILEFPDNLTSVNDVLNHHSEVQNKKE